MEGDGHAGAGRAEGQVKTEEQREGGGEEQPDQTEGSATDGVREDEGGGGGGMGQDYAWKERAVSQDHSYLPYAGEKQEEGEDEGSTANQSQNKEAMEQSRMMGSSETLPMDLQADGEGEAGASDHSFLCVCCGSSFSSEPALVAHRRSQHGLQEALHHCPVCGESFMNTTLFLYHRRQHREKEDGSGAGPGDGVKNGKKALGLLPSSVPSGGAKSKNSSGISPSQKTPFGKDHRVMRLRSLQNFCCQSCFFFTYQRNVMVSS